MKIFYVVRCCLIPNYIIQSIYIWLIIETHCSQKSHTNKSHHYLVISSSEHLLISSITNYLTSSTESSTSSKVRSISRGSKVSYSGILISSKYGFLKASSAGILLPGLNSNILQSNSMPYGSVPGYFSDKSCLSLLGKLLMYFIAFSYFIKSKSSLLDGVPITSNIFDN